MTPADLAAFTPLINNYGGWVVAAILYFDLRKQLTNIKDLLQKQLK